MILHAGLIATRLGGLWRGVLISGPSGAGKSDLALRALDHGFRMVADDRVLAWASGGRAWGRAPETLSGLMEVRGLDVVRLAALPFVEISLVARCGAADGPAERIPDPQFAEVAGISAPRIDIDPREASAPAKLRRALTLFDAAHKRRI